MRKSSPEKSPDTKVDNTVPFKRRKGLLTDFDLHLFAEGNYRKAYEKFGAHFCEIDGKAGVSFSVWAPNAEGVSVIGDFNGWQIHSHVMHAVDSSGVWEIFIPDIPLGAPYKYFIESRYHGYSVEKADPFSFAFEMRPKTASVAWDLSGYDWQDDQWMAERKDHNSLDAPISVYEVHLGSWRRRAGSNEWLTYRELAEQLPAYVKDMGFTHVEFLPVTEHPLDMSWGYQTIGYFAATSRFGTPQDFMFLVDALHRAGIGVVLDWVPAHFPRDQHGLAYFDGTHLYEHADPRQGEHRDWGTLIFNYGRNEVQSFLLASALFWLDKYHIDGLRVDAVASMIYLDYSREQGDWIPNRYGGRENIDAIEFIKKFNAAVYEDYPDTLTFAEESTSWPMVSRPTYVGGLGFGLKWNMGWMNDTLAYMKHDPVHRSYHHNQLTFGMMYAHTENFILPFSHDEVVHMKGSMLSKMPGDGWQKFANLRLLYGYMYAYQGKKLLFMGCEFGQGDEWNHDKSLDWYLLEWPFQRGLQEWVRELNQLLRDEPAFYEQDFDHYGFEWIDCDDAPNSVISFIRWPKSPGAKPIVCVCNFTPIPRYDYRVGVPFGGTWLEIKNSDASMYGGSNMGNNGFALAEEWGTHGRPHTLRLTLPPLSVLYFKPVV